MVVCGLTKKLECVQDWSYPVQHSYEGVESNKKIYDETIKHRLNEESFMMISYGTKSSGKTFALFGSEK